MKLLRLLCLLLVIVFSIQTCTYTEYTLESYFPKMKYIPIPKNDPSVYLADTVSGKTETGKTIFNINKQFETHKNIDCTNYCQDLNCLIECISLEGKYSTRHFHYMMVNDCNASEMMKFFNIHDKQCQFGQIAEGDFLDILMGKNHVLRYFKNGGFKLMTENGETIKSEEVVAEIKMNNENDGDINEFTITIKAPEIMKKFQRSKVNDFYYCVNAVKEFKKNNSNGEEITCDFSKISFSSKNQKSQNKDEFLKEGDLFIKEFPLDVDTPPELHQFNLYASYGEVDNNYLFHFDSYQCYSLFLKLTRLPHLNVNNLFLVDKGEQNLLVHFDTENFEILELDTVNLEYTDENKYKLMDLSFGNDDKFTIKGMKNGRIEMLEMQIYDPSRYKNDLLLIRNSIKDYSILNIDSGVKTIGVIKSITPGKINFIEFNPQVGKEWSIFPKEFKVKKEGPIYKYEIIKHIGNAVIFSSSRDMTKDLVHAVHIDRINNEFYFHNKDDVFGKLIFNSWTEKIQVEKFGYVSYVPQELDFKDFKILKSEEFIDFEYDDNNVYQIINYVDYFEELGVFKENMVPCSASGYRYILTNKSEIKYANELEESRYISPTGNYYKDFTSGRVKSDILKEILGKKNNYFRILNLHKQPEDEVQNFDNYMLEIVSRKPNINRKFEVRRVWFIQDKLYSTECSEFKTLISKQPCDYTTNAIDYYGIENSNDLAKEGSILFSKFDGKGTATIGNFSAQKITFENKNNFYNRITLNTPENNVTAKVMVSAWTTCKKIIEEIMKSFEEVDHKRLKFKRKMNYFK
jgi:hypothetical protein